MGPSGAGDPVGATRCGDPPAPADIVEELQRVLSSAAFSKSERSRAFLSFVVSESLAGRGDRISERTVGRWALGRGPDFDGQRDASVRVSATRVRQALERYYAGPGADDRLRIALPPGSYLPVYEMNAVAPPAQALVPGIAVLTPDHAGEGSARALAESTADALVQRLSEYDGLVVVGPTTAPAGLAEAGRLAGVTHVLQGRVVVRDGTVRLAARLVSSAAGSVVWSQAYDGHATDAGVFEVEDRWAREVASRVADHGGVVIGEAIARALPAPGSELRARLAYYAYIDRTTKESITLAADALDEALAAGAHSAPLLAMRGAVANAAVLQGVGDPAGDTALAERLAREALTLDAGNAHAYLVLGGAARAQRRWGPCRHYAEEAVLRSPSQPANLVSAGLLIAAAGDWPKGIDLIEQGLRLNPRFPVHAHLWLALGNIVLGHYDRALAEATLIDVEGEVFGPLYRALALSGLGHVDDARPEVARLLALEPRFVDEAAERFTAALNLTSEQVGRIVALLEQARPG